MSSPKQNTGKSNYGKLYGKTLTAEQEAEMQFNFVRYIELLIVLDQQHREWVKEHKEPEENDK